MNQWINWSQKIYKKLLNLYPKAYKDEYAEDMLQVFRDECKLRYEKKGLLSIFLYWLKILPDLSFTVVKEHLALQTATWGLMEPVPNKPLPWKGVVLVLLPGLVYLVAQIGQLTGKSIWYTTVHNLGALLLILPVLLVWIIKRRFPIWGLIPLGLLYRLVADSGYQVAMRYVEANRANPIFNFIAETEKIFETYIPFVAVVLIITILFLVARYLKHSQPAKRFWVWLSVFGALILTQFVFSFITISQYDIVGGFSFASIREILHTYRSSFAWELYDQLTLLLLVFLTTLFIRRHGFFAILILVGYTIPTILVGTYLDFESLTNSALVISIVTIAILIYRTLLTLVMPVWLSRASRQSGKRRAVLFSVFPVLLIQISAHFVQLFFSPDWFSVNIQWVTFVFLDMLELCMAYFLVLSIVEGKPGNSSAELLVQENIYNVPVLNN